MGKVKKQKKDKGESKALAKAQKAAKGAKKSEKKETKTAKKQKGKDKDALDDFDFIRTLAEERERWAAEHTVTESVVDGPPSRRANASLTACPVKEHLYLFGGEYYDGTTVEIYPDMFRYDIAKNEWRRFTSPTSPGPRSAHQVVASPAGGGKLWLFGGEYSAPNQSSFHHYRDLWSFDISTHSWERFDTKLRPSARSGHRMAMWKHLLFLFGGFQDTGIRTSYLADLWVWDTLNYKWHQIEMSELVRKPGARSGFSFLPCAEGVVLHGGYTKQYEGKRVTGMALSDTWLLRIPPQDSEGGVDYKQLKWEKRKNVGYAPSPRSGCTMALWAAKGMGVLFGGVCDDDKDEETLESVFYNQLFGYNMAGRDGRWISLPLKKKKKQGGGAKKKKAAAAAAAAAAEERKRREEQDEMDPDVEVDGDGDDKMDEDEQDDPEMAAGEAKPWEVATAKAEAAALAEDDDPDDPEKSIPMARYNTMLAVQRNTLYIYGGILENGPKEFTLDDFYTLQLDKLDRFNCLKECLITSNEWKGSDSENDDDDSDDSDEDDKSDDGSDGDDDSDDGGIAQDEPMKDVQLGDLKLMTDAELAAHEAEKIRVEKEELRKRATAFLGVSSSAERTPEDVFSTPQPGESLAQFFTRSKEFWTQKAHEKQDGGARGKDLRRDGFALAEDAFREYQPLLEEIARIQAQAGLDAEELARGARAGLGTDSRNRR